MMTFNYLPSVYLSKILPSSVKRYSLGTVYFCTNKRIKEYSAITKFCYGGEVGRIMLMTAHPRPQNLWVLPFHSERDLKM